LKARSGQALTELALVAPIFLSLFWFSYQLALLVSCRLKLVSLAREFALGRGRLEQGKVSDQDLIGKLAVQQGLDPARLDWQVEALASGTSGLSGGLANALNAALGADHIHLAYHFSFSGLARRVLPQGILLEESLVCKSGFWKAAL
jgi:hypothetical protein